MNRETLYVSDMDGTLLNSNSVLSQYTTDKLNELIANEGVLFTVATARTPATVVSLMSNIKATVPFIVMTGAALWDSNADSFISVKAMPNDDVRQILEVFERHGINPFVYRRHENTLIVNHVEDLSDKEKEFIEPRIKTKYKRLHLSAKLETDSPDEAVLVFSMGEYGTEESIVAEIKDKNIQCAPACYYDIFDTSQGILDIYAPSTTKAHAIKQLAETLGVERIVVFGDNRNDIPMMKIADHSVAVSNAFDDVKAIADEVIGSNDEDAVVKWIERDVLTSRQ